MPSTEREGTHWRAVHAAATILVIVAFLLSVREILNPFVLFLLLMLMLAPFEGGRMHLAGVTVAGVLTAVWILRTTGFLLAPFMLALVFAYIFRPVVRRMEGPRVPRAAAIAFLSLPLLAAIALAVLIGIPVLSQQIARFIQAVPALLETGAAWAERVRLELLRRDLPYVDEAALLARIRGLEAATVIEYLQERQAAIAAQIWRGVMGAGRGLAGVLTVFGYIVLTPILTFYMLRDWERWTGRVADLLPPARREGLLGFVRAYDLLLSRYLRGQLVAAAAVGVLTGVGFALVGFPYALLLGVIAGVFNVVPYLGLVASLLPALVIAFFSGQVLLSLGKIALVFAVVQLLESAVVSPRIVGEAVGLHPVWVILALAVSGFFFGFVGLLLAIPLAVLVKMLLALGLERYRRTVALPDPHG